MSQGSLARVAKRKRLAEFEKRLKAGKIKPVLTRVQTVSPAPAVAVAKPVSPAPLKPVATTAAARLAAARSAKLSGSGKRSK